VAIKVKGEYNHTKESVEEYIRLAKDVNSKELIEKLKNYLPRHSKVLELGSGPGTDLKILNETYYVTGSDNSREFLNHLKSAHPKGSFLDLDAVSLNTDEMFDALYSNKVLHHLFPKRRV
jgi:trans-aconitate methyltransferase